MAVLRIHSPIVGREERVFDWDGEPITLGRDATCEVVLLERAASRRHARLEWIAGEAHLTDCDSDNGVWIDGERVESRALRDGDTFQIGNTKITLVHDPFAQSTLAGEPAPSATVKVDRRPDTNPDSAAPNADDDVVAAEENDQAAPAPAPEERAAQSDWSLGVQPTALGSSDGPMHSASASSVYSLGGDPNEGNQGPDDLGHGVPSSPSDYSLGDAAPSGPGLLEGSVPSVYSLGHANTTPGPGAPVVDRSGPSVYSLGDDDGTPGRQAPVQGSAPSVYSLDGTPPSTAPGPAPSAPSVYSLDGTPPSAAPGPAPSAPSVYSLDGAPPSTSAGSAPSVYSLDGTPPSASPSSSPGPSGASVYSMGGDAAPPSNAAPAPAVPTSSGRSDYSLGAPPHLPGVGPDTSVAGAPVAEPAAPLHVPPPARISRVDSSRLRVRRAGPTLGLGLLMLVAGAAAIITALIAGYDPRELATLLGTG
ncbi:MAG: FHA domain-containing protein [Myxococcota bacterium]